MKIVVVARSTPYHERSGGMERVAWDLVNEWVAMGHDVDVITTPLSSKVNEPDVSLITLPGKTGRYSSKWFRSTVARVKEIDPDVVLGVSAAAHRIAGCVEMPVVMQAHGTALDELRTKLRTPRVRSAAGIPLMIRALAVDLLTYRKYSAVVAIGPAVRRTLGQFPSWSKPSLITVIENGVAGPSGNIVKSSEGIVFVGRLLREKGADLAIRAMQHIEGDLTIVGEGPESEALSRAVDSLGLSERVSIVGALPHSAVRELIASKSVLVVPSRRREGLPTVILEALAAETPVVTSQHVAEGLGVLRSNKAIRAVSLTAPDIAAAVTEIQRERPQVSLPPQFLIRGSADRYIELFERLIGCPKQQVAS